MRQLMNLFLLGAILSAAGLILLSAFSLESGEKSPEGKWGRSPVMSVHAQTPSGQSIFEQKCKSCHTIGQGVLVGPDLQGVTTRREESWLRVQIKSPSVHRAQNDPISMGNLAKFGIPMPYLGLTEQQVEAVIAYLKNAEPAPVSTPAQYLPTLAIGMLAIVGLTLIGLIAGTKRVEVRP